MWRNKKGGIVERRVAVFDIGWLLAQKLEELDDSGREGWENMRTIVS